MIVRTMYRSTDLYQGQRRDRTGPGRSRTTDLECRKPGKAVEAIRRIVLALPMPMALRIEEGGAARA